MAAHPRHESRSSGSRPCVIVVLDQVTKALVRAKLPLHESVTVIPGFFDLTHVRNTGAAFGMLNSVEFAYKPLVMVVVALVALGAVGELRADPARDAANRAISGSR